MHSELRGIDALLQRLRCRLGGSGGKILGDLGICASLSVNRIRQLTGFQQLKVHYRAIEGIRQI